MKLSIRYFLVVSLALASQGVVAAETYLSVFFGDAPLQGLEVVFDGETIGQTDSLGSAETDVEPGTHNVELVRDGETVSTFSFSTNTNQDAEITVTFPEEGAAPQVDIKKYTVGDTSVTGTVGGVVRDSDGEPLAGAVVSANGASATTDAEGRYQIQLPRGEYDIAIEHPEFIAASIDDLRVMANVARVASAKLQRKSSTPSRNINVQIAPPIEEVIILGTLKSSEESAFELERYSLNVADAIDIEQIERLGDTTVAAAVKRVVGVFVLDDKYAVIRGLGGRYISSTLNGFLMPSTDPLRRDVQLDLFPSNILQNIEIQKSYSANLPGNTTAGALVIGTKGLPDERILKASASLGYRTDVTGDEIITYQSSSSDWAGFDGGKRNLSDIVLDRTNQGQGINICSQSIDPSCVEPIEAAALAITFGDDYRVKEKEAIPDLSASLAYGDVFDLGDGEFGVYSTASYKYETKSRQDAVLNDPFDDTGMYERSEISIAANAYVAAGYQFRDDDEILSRTIFLRNTEDTTRSASGVDFEDRAFSRVILEWVEREFLSQQFTGEHKFESGGFFHNLDWRGGYSQTTRYEPDRRTYTYLNGNLANSAVERRWSELDEDSIDLGLDYKLSFDINSFITNEVQIGALISDKERDVDLYRFGIRSGPNGSSADFSNPNIEEVLSYRNYVIDAIRLAVRTTETDSYNSEEEFGAAYIQNKTDFGDAWTLFFGVRQEDFRQFLRYPFEVLTTQTEIDRRAEVEELESDESLPFLSLIYRPVDQIQLRAGISRTVSYPGLIERSESFSYDPDTDEPILGNPDLEVSTIDNLDLRVDYYFTDEESVSLALFGKTIENPVEAAIPDASGSAASGKTFSNAEEAEVFGIEIEANKNIIDKADWLAFVTGNISLTESEVILSEENLRLEGANAQGRELQGLAPVLVNLQFGLDHYATEQKFTLVINYVDEYINRISRGENVGPEYIAQPTFVDFTYEKLFGESFSLKASIKNLLDDDIRYERDDRVLETYTVGTRFAVGVSYDF